MRTTQLLFANKISKRFTQRNERCSTVNLRFDRHDSIITGIFYLIKQSSRCLSTHHDVNQRCFVIDLRFSPFASRNITYQKSKYEYVTHRQQAIESDLSGKLHSSVRWSIPKILRNPSQSALLITPCMRPFFMRMNVTCFYPTSNSLFFFFFFFFFFVVHRGFG